MRIPCQAVIREPRRPAETWGKVLSKREQRSESNARVTRIIRFKICLINCVIVWGEFSSLKLCREAVSGFMLIRFHTSLATPCHCWWLTHMSIRSLWKNLHFSGTRRTSLTNSPTAKTKHRHANCQHCAPIINILLPLVRKAGGGLTE